MKPRARKSAATNPRTTVKASVILDVYLHSRVAAAASLRGISNNALMADAIRKEVKDIIVTDRAKPAPVALCVDSDAA